MKSLKIKKVPIEIVIFTLIVICIERFMYLVNNNTFKVIGLFNIDDFSLMLYILLFITVYIKYFRFKRKKYRYKFIVIFPIILAITSSYMGLKVYNQPFILGFIPQRFFILTYLLYFPIKKMIDCNKKNIDYIKNVLIYIGTIELVLFIAQYFLIDKVVYLFVRISSRFGETRLPIESFLLLILPFILINEIFNKRNIKRNYFLLGLNLFYIVFVIKTRMVILGIVCTLSLLIFVYKKGSNKILVILLLIVFAIIGVNTDIGKSYLRSVSKEYRHNDVNSLVRKEAQTFYIIETSKSPLLGRGFVNTKWSNATKISMYDKGYYFNDNGIIGFYYLYGLSGVLWVGNVFFIIFSHGCKIVKKNGNYYFLAYAINSIIICITFFTWYFQQGALYLLFTLVLIDEYKQTEQII